MSCALPPTVERPSVLYAGTSQLIDPVDNLLKSQSVRVNCDCVIRRSEWGDLAGGVIVVPGLQLGNHRLVWQEKPAR